ncbi:hypothetical protein ACOQNP_23015 [Ectopseudomonas khazarica]|uniref:hypothetical protein n=1 Tax=Ectopseudomonas khazarica TaxID=2502979 RepID=UPI0012DF2E98
MAMKNGKKLGSFVLAIVALIVGLVLFYGDRVVISFYGGGLVFNHSTSMREHRVSVGGTGFCVAKSYFVFSNSLHPGSNVGLILAAELEGLEPWNVYLERIDFYENKKKLSKKEVKEVNRKRIDMEIGYLRDKGEVVDMLWRERMKGAKESKEGGYVRLVSDSPLAANYEYYLMPEGRADYSHVIGCNQGARCRLESRYSDAIWYKVDFDESVLEVVGSIESRVREFMEHSICD